MQLRCENVTSGTNKRAPSSTEELQLPTTLTASCPVCGATAPLTYRHPEARIHRCPQCTHAFTDPSSVTGFEQYSSDYYNEEHRNWFTNPDLRLFDWIEKQLPSNARSVIDVGCGRGDFLAFLRKRRPNLRLAGVDLSTNKNSDGIEFYTGDVLNIDLGTFDAVVSLATIEHVSEVTEFAKRLRSLCNPAGVVVVMTLDDNSLLYWTARFVNRLGMPTAFNRLYSAHHLNHFTGKSLAQLLERNGLRVKQRRGHSPPFRAIDVPARSLVLRSLFIAAAATLATFGNLIGRSYLQTLVTIPKKS